MQIAKQTKSNIIGLFVTVTEAKDATVYKVVDKHPEAPQYLLAYTTPRGMVTGGWVDLRMMQPATVEQIAAAGYNNIH